MYSCSNQWGYTPLGALNIPADHCNVPLNPSQVVSGTTVKFQWQAPHDVLYFELQHGTAPGVYTHTHNVYGQNYAEAGLPPTSTIYWRVRSVCATDPLRVSEWTAEQSFQTGEATPVCAPVMSGSITLLYLYAGVKAVWSVAVNTFFTNQYTLRYRIKDNTLSEQVVQGLTATEYLIPRDRIVAGKEYELSVRRTCDGFEAEWGDWVPFSAALLPCLPPPTSVSVIKTHNSAEVHWPAVPGATGYTVLLGAQPVATRLNALSLPLMNLSAGTDYNVTVLAEGVGCMGEPATKSFQTDPAPCGAPSGLALELVNALSGAAIVGKYVKGTWEPVAGVTAQRIYIDGQFYKEVAADATTFTTTDAYTAGDVIFEVVSVCGTRESQKVGATIAIGTICNGLSNLALTATKNSITATFQRGNAAVVYLKLNNGPKIEIPGSSHTFYNLTPDTAYTVDGEGYDEDGTTLCLTDTAAINTQPLDACPLPQNITTEFLPGKKLRISWTVASGSGPFEVQVNALPVVLEENDFTVDYDVSSLAAGTEVTVSVKNIATGCTASTATAPYTLPEDCAVYNGFVLTWLADKLRIEAPGLTYASLSLYEKGLTVDGSDYYWLRDQTVFPVELAIAPSLRCFEVVGKCASGLTAPVQALCAPCIDIANLVVRAVNGYVTATWSGIANAYGYEVELKASNGYIKTTTVTQAVFTSDLLPVDGRMYEVRVRPLRSAGVYCNWSAAKFAVMEGAPAETAPCSVPVFTLTMQDSSLRDPEAPTGTTVDNSDPAVINYATIIGNSFDRTMTFKDANGNPIDITGYTFHMQIHVSGLPDSWIKQVTSANGLIINGGVTGQIQIAIPADQMGNPPFTSGALYRYYLTWTTNLGIVKTIVIGDFIVNPPGSQTY